MTRFDMIPRAITALLTLSMAAIAPNGLAGADEPSPVILGALYNLTGSQSGLDIPSARGARLATMQVNQTGGFLGTRLELIVRDGKSDPNVIGRETAILLKSHPTVSVLIGLSDTDMVLAGARVAAENRRPFVTSGATSPKLPAEVPEYLFLACFGDNVQAAAAAEWAIDTLKARTALVLYNQSMSYTRLLHGYFESRFTELGGRLVSSVGYQPDRLSDAFTNLPPADVVYLAAGPEDAVAGSALLREAGITAPIIGGDGFDSVGLWKKHPGLKDIYFTTHAYLGPDSPNPRVKAFREAYLSAYGGSEPDAFAALGYDTVNLVLQAMRKGASPDPEDILGALSQVSRFEGVTGTLTYPPGSRIPQKSVTILRIDSGNRSMVTEWLPSAVPPP